MQFNVVNILALLVNISAVILRIVSKSAISIRWKIRLRTQLFIKLVVAFKLVASPILLTCKWVFFRFWDERDFCVPQE